LRTAGDALGGGGLATLKVRVAVCCAACVCIAMQQERQSMLAAAQHAAGLTTLTVLRQAAHVLTNTAACSCVLHAVTLPGGVPGADPAELPAMRRAPCTRQGAQQRCAMRGNSSVACALCFCPHDAARPLPWPCACFARSQVAGVRPGL
jgi:hypothetical protein